MTDTSSQTDRDRFLIDNAEIAVSNGAKLLSWWKEKQGAGSLLNFELTPRGTSLKVTCFWDTIELGDKQRSVMGCLWKSRFKRRTTASPTSKSTLESFIKCNFLGVCKNARADGSPGGFTFKPTVYKLKNGQVGGFSEEVAVELAEIGEKYEWVVFQCDVFNFFSTIPPFNKLPKIVSKFPRVAAYDLIHEDYFDSFTPAPKGTVAECGFGYTFLPCEVVKSNFGYGPGRFVAAIKQFRFALMEDGDLEVQMVFISAPRSEKVLYLRGFDPVYSSIHLINALTFNIFKLEQRAHDRLDRVMLAHHVRVYQNLIDGMREYWETQNWAGADRDGLIQSVGAANP